jgi:hypothetical protein
VCVSVGVWYGEVFTIANGATRIKRGLSDGGDSLNSDCWATPPSLPFLSKI